MFMDQFHREYSSCIVFQKIPTKLQYFSHLFSDGTGGLRAADVDRQAGLSGPPRDSPGIVSSAGNMHCSRQFRAPLLLLVPFIFLFSIFVICTDFEFRCETVFCLSDEFSCSFIRSIYDKWGFFLVFTKLLCSFVFIAQIFVHECLII